jgi:hypothetical protein
MLTFMMISLFRMILAAILFEEPLNVGKGRHHLVGDRLHYFLDIR